MLQIDLPTRSEILKFAEIRSAPCVTIYLATTPIIVTRALKSGARIVAARRDDVTGKGVLSAILRYAI